MPQVFKKLCGVALPATTLTALYTAPASTQVIVSSIVIANRAATATTVRLTHAVGGAADAVDQTIVPDVSIGGNTLVTLTIGACLQPTDVLRASAGAASVTVTAWGEERTP